MYVLFMIWSDEFWSVLHVNKFIYINYSVYCKMIECIVKEDRL